MRREITLPESDKLIYHPSVSHHSYAAHYLCLQPEGDNVKISVRYTSYIVKGLHPLWVLLQHLGWKITNQYSFYEESTSVKL